MDVCPARRSHWQLKSCARKKENYTSHFKYHIWTFSYRATNNNSTHSSSGILHLNTKFSANRGLRGSFLWHVIKSSQPDRLLFQLRNFTWGLLQSHVKNFKKYIFQFVSNVRMYFTDYLQYCCINHRGQEFSSGDKTLSKSFVDSACYHKQQNLIKEWYW